MRTLGRQPKGARLERMKAAATWVDGSFRNIHPMLPHLRRGPMPTVSEFLRSAGRVPPAPLPSVDPRAGWSRPVETGLRATWLGHSTVLLEIDGARVLTDPVWGERCSPLGFAGPKRFQPVPIAVAALPELDAILVSHDHYDHLDYPTIRELAVSSDAPFVVSLGIGAHLEAWGVPEHRIVELDWWESWSHPRKALTLTAAPSQHFSGRGPTKRNSTLWSSFVARGSRHAVFFSGDTGLTTQYVEIRSKLGPFDLIMLEVGAHHPSWGDIHLGPDNAMEALAMLGGGAFLPVHWGTFALAIHDWDYPGERLLEIGQKEGVQLVMPRLGEVVEPSRVEKVDAWWRRGGGHEPVAVDDEAKPQDGDAPIEWPID
jgi:L-ascorbate metabolism protein UlaG (beta-lactamase superfamily)